MADKTEHLPDGPTMTSRGAEVICNALAANARLLTGAKMEECKLDPNAVGGPAYVSHGDKNDDDGPPVRGEGLLAGLGSMATSSMLSAALQDGYAHVGTNGVIEVQNNVPLVELGIVNGPGGHVDISVPTFDDVTPQFQPLGRQKPETP